MTGTVLAALLAACAGPESIRTALVSKAHSADWQPGDEIPGWPAETCERRNTADTLVHDPAVTDGSFWGLHSVDGAGYVLAIYAPPGYSEQASCEWEEGELHPCLYGHLLGSFLELPYTDLLGVDRFESLDGNGFNPVLGWDSSPPSWCEDCRDPVGLSICLSQVRPDLVEGIFTIEFMGDEYLPIQEYPALYFEYEFRYLVSPHDAWDFDAPHFAGEECPTELGHGWWGYNSNYDTAWPWEDITDPFIRQAVYDMYYPCNL